MHIFNYLVRSFDGCSIVIFYIYWHQSNYFFITNSFFLTNFIRFLDFIFRKNNFTKNFIHMKCSILSLCSNYYYVLNEAYPQTKHYLRLQFHFSNINSHEYYQFHFNYDWIILKKCSCCYLCCSGVVIFSITWLILVRFQFCFGRFLNFLANFNFLVYQIYLLFTVSLGRSTFYTFTFTIVS